MDAAKLMGMSELPTLALSHLSATERRVYILADNKLTLNAGRDADTLAIELQGLIDLELDMEVTGFALVEVDFILDASREKNNEPKAREPADRVPSIPGVAVTRRGDL